MIDAERGQKPVKVGDTGAQRIAGKRALGVAVAPQVIQNNVVTCGSKRIGEREVVAGEIIDDQTVKQHNCLSAPGYSRQWGETLDVQTHAVS
jgi:hypothetical protein